MTQLTALGFQILELIERRMHLNKDEIFSLTREKLNDSIRIPDRDFNMSISFYEQQGWVQMRGDLCYLSPLGQSVLREYRQKNPKAVPAIQIK